MNTERHPGWAGSYPNARDTRGDLDRLITATAAAGVAVDVAVDGTARPLSPQPTSPPTALSRSP